MYHLPQNGFAFATPHRPECIYQILLIPLMACPYIGASWQRLLEVERP